MVRTEEMQRIQCTITNNELPYYTLLQPGHISRSLTFGAPVPQLPGNAQLLPRHLRDFTSDTVSTHWSHLAHAGLSPPPELLFRSISWSLIGAALERWNPETHTFFFRVGELTILLEEVPLLLDLPMDPAAPPTYQTDLPDLRTLLRRLTHDDAIFELLTHDGQLNLRRLWAYISGGLLSPSWPERRAARFGLLLLMAGTYLFPDPHGYLSHEHVALMVHHLYGDRGSLAQPVLAHLYAGMDSAATGGPFFGSPFLLSLWLERHFSFGIHLTGTVYHSRTGMPTRAPRASLRRSFDLLSDAQVTFSLPEVAGVLLPSHPRSECTLVGAVNFAIYSPQRCTRQFSADFQIPRRREDIRSLERRTHDAFDARRAHDVRLHWECHTRIRGLSWESDGQDLALRQRRYQEWIDQRTVTDLEVVARSPVSHGIPVPPVPSFEEFEGQTHRRT